MKLVGWIWFYSHANLGTTHLHTFGQSYTDRYRLRMPTGFVSLEGNSISTLSMLMWLNARKGGPFLFCEMKFWRYHKTKLFLAISRKEWEKSEFNSFRVCAFLHAGIRFQTYFDESIKRIFSHDP